VKVFSQGPLKLTCAVKTHAHFMTGDFTSVLLRSRNIKLFSFILQTLELNREYQKTSKNKIFPAFWLKNLHSKYDRVIGYSEIYLK